MKNSFKILRLQKNNLDLFVNLVQLLNEVFEEPNLIASKKQLKKLLMQSDFYAVVAIINDLVVGGLTAYELERYYTDQSELHIYDIAVKTNLHNQGIGKALVNYLKEYASQHEIETIFVQAHSEDKQAVKFYESTIGKGEKVDYFNLNMKTR
ncbi:GNAT family N-acetyltransferase [Croceitalea vernalis]|uniref:GNAT family N-acetyltransferase n=1 Tax=Croceitalea vernalis TaxID=3075599 RepID=A0ABU3BH21_9FLAO|nr:GNAT family N-acetyltransferase [Croceitalea sp. P007]MDT0621465.1 GNAT family N-acetyltransferase [Croceitalea sp. P007]